MDYQDILLAKKLNGGGGGGIGLKQYKVKKNTTVSYSNYRIAVYGNFESPSSSPSGTCEAISIMLTNTSGGKGSTLFYLNDADRTKQYSLTLNSQDGSVSSSVANLVLNLCIPDGSINWANRVLQEV